MANCQQEVKKWRAKAEKAQKEIVDLKASYVKALEKATEISHE
ncbi:hypothetical protein [Coxiella-like endosymbiont]|nr:hypothetical protein [Coxiella-like endosymbiont]